MPGPPAAVRPKWSAWGTSRPIGARHSFNGLADSAGELVDLRDIDQGFLIDPERRTVTFGAATNYGVLAAHLQRMGWAFHNMASLSHVSIAGARGASVGLSAGGFGAVMSAGYSASA